MQQYAGQHRPASETADVPMMPNIECRLGSLVLFQGIGTSIAMKLYIFVNFRGGGGGGAGPGPLSPM